jgi:S1-C subfamily serine protease
MITSDVLGRVFCLKIGDSTATGFAIDVDNRQYIVTAKHFTTNLSVSNPLQLLFENKWNNFGGTIVGHGVGEIDISVLALNGVTSNPALKLTPDQSILYGQDVYFVGFPYGSWGDSKTAFIGHAIPFVRKAIVSCVEDGPNGEHRNFLDGHNVPGFSGGPVVYAKGPLTDGFIVTSVISGYKFVNSPVYLGSNPTGATIQYNTGIIITYGIRHALDLIKANPIGPQIK